MISSVEVERERAVLDQVQPSSARDVARVHLAGVHRQLAAQVERARGSSTPCATTSLAGLRSARSCRRSRRRGPRSPSRASCPRTIAAVISIGAALPGTDGGRDHHVRALRRACAISSRSLAAGRRDSSLRVAARVHHASRRASSAADERGAQALHLLAHRGPHVERLDHRAQPARGRDRLQARRRRRRARTRAPARWCRPRS